MSVGTADVAKAVETLWESSELGDTFEGYWSESQRERYVTLNEGEAAPGTPFPYAVYREEAIEVTGRMSSTTADRKRHIREVPWVFEIHAQQTAVKGAKQLASELAEEVLKVFGGHPTRKPSSLNLDTGNFLVAQYVTDHGERTGDDTHVWTVRYNLKLDVPVAV